jgi:hypothetical protein
MTTDGNSIDDYPISQVSPWRDQQGTTNPNGQHDIFIPSRKLATSLSAAIRILGSHLEPCLERDLATDLHSGSTLIAIKDESNRRIRFRRHQEIYSITTRGDQGIALSYRNASENRSHYRSILWLYPSRPL